MKELLDRRPALTTIITSCHIYQSIGRKVPSLSSQHTDMKAHMLLFVGASAQELVSTYEFLKLDISGHGIRHEMVICLDIYWAIFN